MQISTNQLTIVFLIITTLIVGIILLTILADRNIPSNTTSEKETSTIVDIGDKQLLEITAKGGYSPSLINAKADKASVLRVNTKGTFDCSSAFTIPKLGIRKNLPPNGATDFEIPAQPAGTEINGTCSMGMYHFTIKFS